MLLASLLTKSWLRQVLYRVLFRIAIFEKEKRFQVLYCLVRADYFTGLSVFNRRNQFTALLRLHVTSRLAYTHPGAISLMNSVKSSTPAMTIETVPKTPLNQSVLDFFLGFASITLLCPVESLCILLAIQIAVHARRFLAAIDAIPVVLAYRFVPFDIRHTRHTLALLLLFRLESPIHVVHSTPELPVKEPDGVSGSP
jgi:hypothetical protein